MNDTQTSGKVKPADVLVLVLVVVSFIKLCDIYKIFAKLQN